MKLSGSPFKIEFLKKKLKLVTQTMEEQGVDMWVAWGLIGPGEFIYYNDTITEGLLSKVYTIGRFYNKIPITTRS